MGALYLPIAMIIAHISTNTLVCVESRGGAATLPCSGNQVGCVFYPFLMQSVFSSTFYCVLHWIHADDYVIVT
jgi:hypothetical protein